MGTTTTTSSLMTFEDFERMPDQPGKRELLNGELIEMPPAELKHNQIAHRIYKTLDAAVMEAHSRGEAAQLGTVYDEMGYQLHGDGYVQPDVSVTHAAQPEGKYLTDAPAIAIEVISPSNMAEDLDTKTELYFQFGAREVWLTYRKTRHVVVYVAGAPRVVRENETVTTPLLPGFAMPVAEILGE